MTRWIAMGLVSVGAFSQVGCFPTTTARTETLMGPVHRVNVLSGSELVPLKSSWSTTPGGLAGNVSWKKACVEQGTSRVTRAVVSDSRPNKGGNAAWLVVAGAIAAGGIYALSRASSASPTVYCTDPNNASSCSSDQKAWTDMGGGLLGLGATIGVFSGIEMARSPKRDVHPISTKTRTERGTRRVACASNRALAGLVVAVDNLNGKTWKGTVKSGGRVEIEIPGEVAQPVGVPLPVEVAFVPTSLKRFVHTGQVIGAAVIE